MITAIIYITIRNMRKDCKCLKVIWLVDIAYLIGGLSYHVGRNFDPVVVQTCLLGTAALIFRFIPFVISKYYQSNLAKEHQTTEAKLQLVPEWILAAESLTLLVDFDAWYTVMYNSFFSDIYLEQENILYNFYARFIGSWAVWAFLLLTYSFILYYTMNIHNNCKNYNFHITCVASNLSAIVLLAAFGMHLLANKTILLYSGANTAVASIVMNVLVLIVVITAIVLLMVYRCMSKTRQEKLLPRALY